WVLATLRRLTPDFRRPVTDATLLGEGGLCLDSLGFLEFIGRLETRFGLAVSEAEISPEHFESVARVVGFIGSRQGDSRRAPGARRCRRPPASPGRGRDAGGGKGTPKRSGGRGRRTPRRGS